MDKQCDEFNVPRLDWRSWLFVIGLCVFSFFLHVWNFEYPMERYFDEVYYAQAAQEYIGGKPDSNVVHPPLGKLQIALGVLVARQCNKVVGHRVFNRFAQYRLTSAVCGTFLVFFTFLLAYRLSRGRREIALLAAFLLCTDFMAVAMSRICMLDMVTALWILIAVYCAWRYLECCWAQKNNFIWSLLCALALGISVACKWNGLFAALGCWLVMVGCRDRSWGNFAWIKELESVPNDPTTAEKSNPENSDKSYNCSVASKKVGSKKITTLRYSAKSGKSNSKWSHLRSLWPSAWHLAVLFGVVIGVVYFLSYLYVFMHAGFNWDTLQTIWDYHTLMVNFHYDADQFTHTYLSYFWEWPLVLRPVWLYFHSYSHKVVAGIVCMGSVIFWWPSLVYMMEIGCYGWKKRDAACFFVVLMWLVLWLCWATSTTGGFIYYMLPVVPFMAIAASLVIVYWRKHRGIAMVWCYLAAITFFFIIYWPFLSGEQSGLADFVKLFPSWATRWR